VRTYTVLVADGVVWADLEPAAASDDLAPADAERGVA
jgi:hypothetical protein